MRGVFGAAVFLQGPAYLREPGSTPVAARLVGLGALGIALSILPSPSLALIDCRLSTAFAVSMLVSISLLGPGAYSLDARAYGRREIIISPAFVIPRLGIGVSCV